MTNEDKISKAWRAGDDEEAEMLEVQRLSELARANGPEPEEEERSFMDVLRMLWIRWMT